MELLIQDALQKSVTLLKKWEKPSLFGGGGWHELTTSDHAGAHASCAALKLIAHPLFPLSQSARVTLVEEVVLCHLQPLFAGAGVQAEEAKHSTVKLANLLSAYAAVGRNPQLAAVFQQIVPFGRTIAENLIKNRQGLQWSHWLAQPSAEPRHLPTAAVIDALYRFAEVDGHVKIIAGSLVDEFSERVAEEFLTLVRNPVLRPEVWDLWQRLPLLRTLSIVHSKTAKVRDDFRDIFNEYVARDAFGWGLTCTEDFQKFDAKGSPANTDYVSFNTTACLVRAIIAAIQTDKLELSFFDWATPHLASWAERVRDDEIPTPQRFSYIHQTLTCLLVALDLHLSRKNVLPIHIPMHINPAVFQDRGFRVKPNQGFLITPFDMTPLNRYHVESHIMRACNNYLGDTKNIKVIAGDHNFSGAGIMARIWQHINESSFAIAVCVGANPNVYYEVGVAHTLGRPVLLLGRAAEIDKDIRFDLKGVRYEEIKDFNDPLEIEPKVHKFLGEATRF